MVKNDSLYKSNAVFEKEEFSHSDNDILQLKPFIMYLKSHKVIVVILCIYVGIPQVRILVFDNYQLCPVHLICIHNFFVQYILTV